MMFSNDINPRDLFFSNPIDHFLGQDQDIKTSYESGFSSSHNHTGNSKEVQYKSSQDLFSQSRSQDIFSQNDRTNSQFGSKNLDYERYISQNLLLGKESPRRILSYNDIEKEIRKEKQRSPIAKTEYDENHMKEVKKSLDTLTDCVQKLNSEIDLENKSLQEELTKLNERMSFVEKTAGQNFELIADNFKSFTNMIKKEQSDKKQLNDKISEVLENIQNLGSKIEDYTEQGNKILEENIKKISKNHDEKHKKQLQKLQDQSSHMEKSLRKVNSVIESSLKDFQENVENVFDHKLNSMKDCLERTIHQFNQNRAQDMDSLMSKQTSSLKRYDSSKDDFDFCKYRKPTPISSYESGFNYGNSNAGTARSIQTLTRTHTPLSRIINDYNSKIEPMGNYQFKATVKPEISDYNTVLNYSNIKIKRKSLTPLRNIISPKFKKPMQNPNSHCTPLISKFRSSNRYDDAFFNGNGTFFSKQKYGGMSNKMERTMISNSSPALTVIEAATIAKNSYALRPRQSYNK